MEINKVIQKPIITEKSMALTNLGKYVFKVNMRASKGSISQTIKDLFDVDAVEVTTMIMPGKKRRVGKTARFIKTKKWKKAVVTLKEGQKIDLFDKSS